MTRTTAKKKVSTVTPRWGRWHKSMVKMQNTLKDCVNNPSPHGEKWTYNMTKHWEKKIKEWKELEPAKFD